MDFSIKIKCLRKNKMLTQIEAAKAIGISDRAYLDFEKGKSKPSFETLIAICNYFNVSADYLLGLSEIKERQSD